MRPAGRARMGKKKKKPSLLTPWELQSHPSAARGLAVANNLQETVETFYAGDARFSLKCCCELQTCTVRVVETFGSLDHPGGVDASRCTGLDPAVDGLGSS